MRLIAAQYLTFVVAGNIPDFFARDNQRYLTNLNAYGPVATLHGFFGVR